MLGWDEFMGVFFPIWSLEIVIANKQIPKGYHTPLVSMPRPPRLYIKVRSSQVRLVIPFN